MMTHVSGEHSLYMDQFTNTQSVHSSPSIASPITAHPASIPPSDSMLADLSLPRPISAKTALKMVRTTIKMIMYLRGQMGSTWEQLEQMLQLEQLRREQEQEQEQESFNQESYTSAKDESNDDNYINIPTKSLKEFLQTGERMFVDLEESIYSQLYHRLKSGLSQPQDPESPVKPSNPKLYISLALLFGSTITTPKEQYMIRIGPLEPQKALLKELGSHDRSFGIEVNANQGSESELQQEQKRVHEERIWERKLIQQIMGITSIMDTDEQQYEQSTVSSTTSIPLSNRTRVYLLTKAPAGLVFQGLLPKQMISIQEDYSLDSIIETRKQGYANSGTSVSAATGTKRKRWPVHHVHVLGPNFQHTASSSSSPSSTLLISPSYPQKTPHNDIWYQVGPGIPTLSPLL
ncbi:hypothetical protein BGZ49_002352 [Haplosporangium sp. Z 27]|nr:hypothetical protein BGZ49_002352 [Haplosporangium sp. Z 27]